MKSFKLISLFFILVSIYSSVASASCALEDFQRYSGQAFGNRAQSFRLLAESIDIPSRDTVEREYHEEMSQSASSNNDYRGAERFMAQQSLHSAYSARLTEISNREERKACLLRFADEFASLHRYSELINQIFGAAPTNRMALAKRVVSSRDWNAFLQTKIFEYTQLGVSPNVDNRLISAQITPLYRGLLPLVQYVVPVPYNTITVGQFADIKRYADLIRRDFGRPNITFRELGELDGDWMKFLAVRTNAHRGTMLQPFYEVDLRNLLDSQSRQAIANL